MSQRIAMKKIANYRCKTFSPFSHICGNATNIDFVRDVKLSILHTHFAQKRLHSKLSPNLSAYLVYFLNRDLEYLVNSDYCLPHPIILV